MLQNKSHDLIVSSLKTATRSGVDNGIAKTFDECLEVFKKNGIVLIFSEGKCVNEWHLRPLKKGTARLAITAWEQGIALKVIPLGINYQSFKSFGKNIFANFGKFITRENIAFNNEDAYGAKVQTFNAALKLQLQELVFEIDANNSALLHQTFFQKIFIRNMQILILRILMHQNLLVQTLP